MINPNILNQWRHTQKANRLNKIYQGLRVSDDRPPYVFHGSRNVSRYELEKRGRKTKAVFPPLSGNRKNGVIIPRLKTLYYPITGGSPANFFIKNGGDDEATGESDELAWATLSKIPARTFLAGDYIYLKRESLWREMLDLPEQGVSGEEKIHTTFTAYGTGELPIVNGADLITPGTSWDVHDGDIWKATVTTEPKIVCMDETIGSKKGSIVACVAEFDWYWAANVLYIYSESDPDTTYTSPGVEAGARDYCLRVYSETGDADNISYVTVENMIFKYANFIGAYIGRVTGSASNDFTLQDIEVIAATTNNIFAANYDNLIFRRIVSHDCQEQHGLYWGSTAAVDPGDDALFEYCDLYNNAKCGLQIASSGINRNDNPIVRYNQMHGNGEQGIHDLSSYNAQYYYNLVYENGIEDIQLCRDPDDDPSGTYAAIDAVLYNNTIISMSGAIGIYVDAYATGHVLKNNIVYGKSGVSKLVKVSNTGGADATFDYNDFYAADFTDVFDWKASTGLDSLAAWQAASSQDANSIDSDPLFINLNSDDFHLQSGSPCIEAGTPIAGLTTDKDGIPLGRGTNPDIGCYETLKGGPRRL